MDDQEAWRLEERFWLDEAEQNAALLSPECVMAFPAPTGLMQGAAIVDSLEAAPRWASVAMSERIVGRPCAETLVLAYRAEARREEQAPYVAYCTSTYRHLDGRWRLIQHQQTPIG